MLDEHKEARLRDRRRRGLRGGEIGIGLDLNAVL
jgi:hypothetical protein